MLVAALAGRAEHARAHVADGVDIVVAQGYEAGGHTGEIASMVLVPGGRGRGRRDVPVLAAGGIGSGRQIAAALALGATGVWMGSCWLTTQEYAERRPSRPCARPCWPRVRPTRCAPASTPASRPGCCAIAGPRRGASPSAPAPLPMPLQNLLVSEAHNRLMRSGDPTVVAMPVGQIVGRMNEVRPVAEVMSSLVAEADETLNRLAKLT